MAADEQNQFPDLARYVRNADEALAKAQQSSSAEECEEFQRIAAQWLLIAEENVKKALLT